MALKIKLKRISSDPTTGSQMSVLEDGEVVINPTSGGIFYKYNNGGGDSIAEPAALHRPAAFQSTLSAVGEMNSLGNFKVGTNGNVLTVNSSTGVSTFGGPIQQSGGAVNFAGDVTFSGAVTLPVGGAEISTNDDFFASKNVTLGSSDSDLLLIYSETQFLGPINFGSNEISTTGAVSFGSASNATTINGNLSVLGNSTLGNANSDVAVINGNVTIGTDQSNTVTVKGDITLGTSASNDTVYVNAVSSFSGGVTIANGYAFTANGNVTLGNESGDTIIVNGTTSFNEDVTFGGDVIPDTNDSFILGASGQQWSSVWANALQSSSTSVGLFNNGTTTDISMSAAGGLVKIRSDLQVDSDASVAGVLTAGSLSTGSIAATSLTSSGAVSGTSLSTTGGITFDSQTFVDTRKFTIKDSSGSIVLGFWGLDTDTTINN